MFGNISAVSKTSTPNSSEKNVRILKTRIKFRKLILCLFNSNLGFPLNLAIRDHELVVSAFLEFINFNEFID